MPSLAALLDLTDEEARGQWGRILQRVHRPRQEPYNSVEVVLCCALFRAVDPHRFGGRNIHLIPEEVALLADLFMRSTRSINIKMLNLDGSRPNGAASDVPFYDAMAADHRHFTALYECVVRAARQMGIGPSRLPDFVERDTAGYAVMLGQDRLPQGPLAEAVEVAAAQLRARQLAADDAQTFRVAEQKIRLGQHRFARNVLENYGHQCAFCEFAPRSLPRQKLLIASHIKPWRDSNDVERLDAANGIASCPMHDAAFDVGLITVNGGLRVHRAGSLQHSLTADVGVKHNFGSTLRSTLRLPRRAAPDRTYLAWHHEHIYVDAI
ncbi:HNH endonuclease [Candidatus Poriferisodalis sp.]|uniref:HNH endonuclease n=1 Tax=Candidatus Poriferisodalis sp. TaxID=3101277 RepID=UPI003B02187B